MNDSSEFKKKLIATIKMILKMISRVLLTILLPVFIVIVILASSLYFITYDDGAYKEGDLGNVPYAAAQSTGSVGVGEDGKINSEYTAQEIWDKNKENKGRVNLYLDNAEQLAKLMNAELVTQFLDTRENPDDPIDWDEMNKVDSKEVQGIIKLKRADADGNTRTMTYIDPETFQDYIERYNKSGDESIKNEILSHFTLEQGDSSDSENSENSEDSENIGIVQGTGKFTQYSDLTESQIKQIASLCQQEQGTTKGAAAEASLMANRFEMVGKRWGTGGSGLYNYIRNCRWWAHASEYMDKQNARKEVVDAVRAVLVNGKRTLPKYIDEHDCISDINSAINKGQAIDVNSRSEYKQYVTKLKNRYGAKYTFYCFPTEGSDPFGYTSKKSRKKYGDAYYDFDTGELVNGKEEDTDTTTDENSTSDNTNTWKWPTEGTTISSKYGPRSSPTAGASSDHKGVDISVPEGTNVYACEDGKVTIAMNSESAGNYIAIDHGNGYVSKYMHNSQLKVKVGDKVKKGDVIALSGNTGISTGAHLHFQIEQNGNAVDPMTFKYDNGNGDGSSTNSESQKGNDKGSSSKYYAKVATWSETTDTVESNDPEVENSSNTTYNMTSTNINYQSVVSQYTMPFDYLWALLVVGEDKDFVLQLADLVYGSEIEITVHDNLTVNTDVQVDTYTKKTRTDTSGQVTISYGQGSAVQNVPASGSWSDEESNDYQTTNTTITKTNTLDIALTKANVWIVNYTQEYTYQKPTTDTSGNETKLDDENYKDKPDSTSNEDTYNHVNDLLEEKKGAETEETYDFVEGNINSIDTKVYHATVNKNRKTTNTVETTEYKSSPGKTIEKTNKKTNEDSEEENFVTIFLKDECMKARKLILEVPSWLYEILASSEKTADMIDLTKYLLYKATGNDYGVKEYDFNVYEPSDFEEVDTGTEGGLSLSTTKFDKATFKKALQEYYNKTKNADFKKNFLDKVDELYDSSVSNNVNPELVVITAKAEGNFKETGGAYNYWGIGVPNGASSGSGFSSLSDGIAGYAKTIKKYETGSYAAMIKQKYKERKAAGCNPNGYGMPGTLSGMQSIYSSLGKHEEGSAGAGGYYYMDPDRAGVKTIYSTHQEFLEKCKNKGGEHAEGKPATIWEQGQYTAWQVEKKLEIWKDIFGKYGSVDSTSSDVNIGKSEVPSNIANGTASQKMKYLFPNGTPSNKNDMDKYMTSVKVAMTNKQGKKYEGTVRVHKSLAKDVQEVFKATQDAGFKIYEVGGYCYRYMNNDSVPKKLSYHSYGIAVDINVNENYSRKGSKVYAGSFWNPSKSEYSIPKNGALVKAFKAKGWKWGGNWSGNYQDYMHFSFTGN